MSQCRLPRTVMACLSGLLVFGLPRPATGQEGQFFTGPERLEIAQEVARLAAIQRQYEDRLMDLPGVLGIGVGLDREKRQLAFLVVVETDAATPDVPREIGGVPVMIERHDPDVPLHGAPGCAQPCHANQLPLPVEMGNSAFTSNFCSACTLGFVACDLETRRRVYVTNAHCSTDAAGCVAAAPIGTPNAHVGPLDANCAVASIVGQTSGQVGPNCAARALSTIDAAKVDSAATQTRVAIRDIGVPGGAPGTVLVGDLVQKSGRTTGWTQGTVAALNYTALVGPYACCGNATFPNQIRVNAMGAGPFIQGGDSGSALLNMDDEIVGLLFSGPASGSAGNANPIGAVLAGLGVILDLSKCKDPPPPERPEFQYAAKFVCGQGDGHVVARGGYFTAINVHNPHLEAAKFRKKVAVALPGEKPGKVYPFVDTGLEADEAFEIDCPDILGHSDRDARFLKGFVVVETDLELDIVAVYTVAGGRWWWPWRWASRVRSIHTERVPKREIATPTPESFEPPDPKHCPQGDVGDPVGEEGCCCNKPRRAGGYWPSCRPGLTCVGNLPDVQNGIPTNLFSVCTAQPRTPVQIHSSQPRFCEQR